MSITKTYRLRSEKPFDVGYTTYNWSTDSETRIVRIDRGIEDVDTVLIEITRDTADDVDRELIGQLSDGLFENHPSAIFDNPVRFKIYSIDNGDPFYYDEVYESLTEAEATIAEYELEDQQNDDISTKYYISEV